MNIVITMAGLGNRFRKAGYHIPKYMLSAHGKTLFEWSMISLTGFFSPSNQYYFIVRKEDQAKSFIRGECQKIGIINPKIIEIDYVTAGQAQTVIEAKAYWNTMDSLLIYNIDTYIEPNEMNFSQLMGDGFLPCFKGRGDHWSFVKLNEQGEAIEIREKKRISENCTVGAYYFRTTVLFSELYKELYIDNQYSEAGEQYVAPMYNLLLKKGGKIYISDIPSNKVHVLGTPEEYEEFKNSYI